MCVSATSCCRRCCCCVAAPVLLLLPLLLRLQSAKPEINYSATYPKEVSVVVVVPCFPSSNRVRVACSNSMQCCYNTVIEPTTAYKSVVHHSKQQMEPPLSSCIHFVHTHFGYAGPVVVVVRSINGRCNLFVRPRAFVPGTERRRRRRRLVFACFVYALAGSAYTCMIQFHSVFYDARIVTDAQSRTLF